MWSYFIKYVPNNLKKNCGMFCQTVKSKALPLNKPHYFYNKDIILLY